MSKNNKIKYQQYVTLTGEDLIKNSWINLAQPLLMTIREAKNQAIQFSEVFA
jgi:hypothetical protein